MFLKTIKYKGKMHFLPLLLYVSLDCTSASLVAQTVKNPPAVQETQDSIPWPGRSPEKGNGNPLQCSCLGNPMDRGAWQATVQRVSELDVTEQLSSQRKLSVYITSQK